MTEYKNYTPLSSLFILLVELFRWGAPVFFLLTTVAGSPPEMWHHPWEAAASIATAIFLSVVAFLGLQWTGGVMPLIVHTSPDGFGVKWWARYEWFQWSDVKAVRPHAWLNQLDIYVTKRMPISKKIAIFNMPKRQITELLSEIKRYVPEVRLKRF